MEYVQTRKAGVDENLPPSSAAVPVAANPAESDLWIFREGHRETSGPAMLCDLSRRLVHARTATQLTDALIEAGELECALADAEHGGAAFAAGLTDALAFALCTGQADSQSLQLLAAAITTPNRVRTSPPEGFTYYALHPIDFGHLASKIHDEPKRCALIGIRSIGTTLSAVTAAALRKQSRPVSRITVRPTGHPYSRSVEFSAGQCDWIREQLARAAQFLIVDEGPGRSGSTFLAVAEALVRTGVPREMITLLGSRQADPNSLLAQQAASRWSASRFTATTPSANKRFERCRYIGGGDWRPWLLSELQGWSSHDWPESWTQMERLKFLSDDGRTLFKFEGMGPFGADVRQRAYVLAQAAFSPHAEDAGDGFVAYSVAEGKVLRATDLNSTLIEQLARYCAFRAATFSVPSDRPDELRHMLEYNVHQEFGVNLHLPEGTLRAKTPVLADGRMQPHEWILGEHFLKTDSVDHGDNHFFPGPCDIAWDLAGAVTEWQMPANAVRHLLRLFRQFSGIDLSAEMPMYLLAYAVFRLGFCKMAVSTSAGDDLERMHRGYLWYRALAQQRLNSQAALNLSAA